MAVLGVGKTVQLVVLELMIVGAVDVLVIVQLVCDYL